MPNSRFTSLGSGLAVLIAVTVGLVLFVRNSGTPRRNGEPDELSKAATFYRSRIDAAAIRHWATSTPPTGARASPTLPIAFGMPAPFSGWRAEVEAPDDKRRGPVAHLTSLGEFVSHRIVVGQPDWVDSYVPSTAITNGIYLRLLPTRSIVPPARR